MKPAPSSLATRLALLFGCTAALLLTGLAWGTYWVLEREFRLDENKLLNDTVALMQTILRENEDLVETLREKLPHDVEAFHNHSYQLRITDSQGGRLYQSGHFPPLSDGFLRSLRCYEMGESGEGIDLQVGESSYRVLQARAQRPSDDQPRLRLLIALETSQKTRTLATYLRALGALVFGGVAAAALAARWLSHQGLQPLIQMTQMVSLLRVDQLSQRFCARPWPGELLPLAQEFDRLLEEIEVGLSRISGFSLDLAHELRTPLTSLQLEAEIALSQPRPAEEYRSVIASSMEELERLSQLVERLLLLARTEAAKQHLQLKPIPVRERVAELVEFHFPQPADVILRIPEQVVLEADPPLLELALCNLFSNALKYGEPPYEVIWKHEPGRACLGVANGGPAVPAEEQNKLFDRLYRLDRSRSQGGHGLGLSLVRSALRAHRGEVELESCNGRTCFWLVFPDA